ncbi:MAG: TadE/TadG family type IV pilus assembly protein [Sphingomicrobium sp.]
MISAFRHRLAADQRGAAVIELAIIAPIFALMTIGVVDMSNAYSRKLALEQGAQRAIEKIMQTTANDTVENTLATEVVCQVNGTDPSGNCLTSPITTANVTVTFRLECNSGGTITSQTTTDPTTFDAMTCASGTPSRYIQVGVTDKYTPMFPIHFAAYNTSDGTYHLSATAGMRTQ